MIRWKPWTVEIVGRYSGNVSPLPFVRFWTQYRADLWCMVMNMQHRTVTGQPPGESLTYWRSRRMP